MAKAARSSALDKEVEACLQRATSLLDKAKGRRGALPTNPDFLTLEGYQCLARHILAQRPEIGNYLVRAENLFDAALKLKRSSPRALMGKACVRASRRDWKQALECFRKVLRRAAPHAPQEGEQLNAIKEVRFALATCFAGLGRHQQAKNALQGVVAADAKDVEALCALAYLESRTGQGNEAKQRAAEKMAQAMTADPTHPAVLCRAADHSFSCGLQEARAGKALPDAWKLAKKLLQRASDNSDVPQVVAEVQYQLGRMEHAQGRFSEARELYKQCVRINPDHLAGVYVFAQCLVHERYFSQAVTVLEKAPPQLRKEPEVKKLLTAAYLATGEHDKQAATVSDSLVTMCPEDVEAWAMRAEAYSRLEKIVKPKVAIDSYERMAELMQASPEARAKVTPQMWNNLGTMRAMHGDPADAKEAYDSGMERVESLQQLGETQDLRVAELTMRFNKAWLAQSQPQEGEMQEAVRLYLALTEEVKWFADAFLQLGGLWQRVGKKEEALRNFQQAIKYSPFLGKLLCSEALRASGKYEEALKWGEKAARGAQANEFQYAHVFVGNLCYEASTHHKTPPQMNDSYLRKAMEYYTKALAANKDCQFAANGIGMVFAKRGKMDIAKQFLESVMNHQAMAESPSVYINLGHVLLEFGKPADIRRALECYNEAKQLDPEDKSVRSYIAQAHFMLEEFELASCALAEAVFYRQGDMQLRFNQATCWEAWARHVLLKKIHERVMTYDAMIEEVKSSIATLVSAVRVWKSLQSEWERKSDSERRTIASTTGAPKKFLKEMADITSHVDYCQHLQNVAHTKLADVSTKNDTMQLQIEAIAKQKAKSAKEAEEKNKGKQIRDKEKHLENEDKAQRLMDTTKTIELGRNMELQKDSKAQRPSKKKRTEEESVPALQLPEQAIADKDVVEGGEDVADMAALFEDDEVIEFHDKFEEGNQQDFFGSEAKLKKDKKDKKAKKEKKEKHHKDKKEKSKDRKEHKKEKKDKKRKREAELDDDMFD